MSHSLLPSFPFFPSLPFSLGFAEKAAGASGDTLSHDAVKHLHLLPQPCGPDDPAFGKAPWDPDFRASHKPGTDSGINILIDISR